MVPCRRCGYNIVHGFGLRRFGSFHFAAMVLSEGESNGFCFLRFVFLLWASCCRLKAWDSRVKLPSLRSSYGATAGHIGVSGGGHDERDCGALRAAVPLDEAHDIPARAREPPHGSRAQDRPGPRELEVAELAPPLLLHRSLVSPPAPPAPHPPPTSPTLLSSHFLTHLHRKPEAQLDEDVRSHIVRDSIRVLRMNDRGGYTVPAEGLYPFQVTNSHLDIQSFL